MNSFQQTYNEQRQLANETMTGCRPGQLKEHVSHFEDLRSYHEQLALSSDDKYTDKAHRELARLQEAWRDEAVSLLAEGQVEGALAAPAEVTPVSCTPAEMADSAPTATEA